MQSLQLPVRHAFNVMQSAVVVSRLSLTLQHACVYTHRERTVRTHGVGTNLIAFFCFEVNLLEASKQDGKLVVTREVNIVPIEKIPEAVVQIHLWTSHRTGSKCSQRCTVRVRQRTCDSHVIRCVFRTRSPPTCSQVLRGCVRARFRTRGFGLSKVQYKVAWIQTRKSCLQTYEGCATGCVQGSCCIC